jgi:hypothetical protein
VSTDFGLTDFGLTDFDGLRRRTRSAEENRSIEREREPFSCLRRACGIR